MTIGVFVAYLNDSYQWGLWQHILKVAKARGVGVIGFCGHGLGAPEPSQAAMNVVYPMAASPLIDGLLVFSNTLGNFHGPRSVSDLLGSIDLPAVSLGFELEGIPSVCSHGGAAMTELVQHLIVTHRRRRLALVTGPEGHQESRQREQAFREALAAEGLQFDERLLYRGNFYHQAGREAIQAFEAQGLSYDALVCLNDHMAVGALQTLRARGVRVPEDVAVTGFDDVAEAGRVTPPLTTVRQPLEAVAERAIDGLLALAANQDFQPSALSCQPTYRQSCGCPPSVAVVEGEGSADDLLAWNEATKVAKAGDSAAALGMMARSVRAQWGHRSALGWWRARLTKLQEVAVPSPLSRWCNTAQAWLAEEEVRWEREAQMGEAERSARVRAHSVALLGLLDLGDIIRYAEENFHTLGIGRFFVTFYENPDEAEPGSVPPWSRWLTTTRSRDRRITEHRFETRWIVPPDAEPLGTGQGWLIEPLVVHSQAIGFIAMECGAGAAEVAETIRETLSTAIRGARLMQQVNEHKDDLEAQVRDRTRELQSVHQDLQEVSNRTMQTIGQDIHDDLCQHLVGISMLASVAEESVVQGGEVGLPAISEIRSLVDAAVVRSRQFARILYPPGLEEHGLVSAIEDLVDTLARPRGNVTFTTEGDVVVRDPSKALQVYRILQESLSNALRHSGSDVILVRLLRRETGILAEVRDFGRGLAPDDWGSGMGSRILRHRAESIGARLEVFNLDPGVCVSCFVADEGVNRE